MYIFITISSLNKLQIKFLAFNVLYELVIEILSYIIASSTNSVVRWIEISFLADSPTVILTISSAVGEISFFKVARSALLGTEACWVNMSFCFYKFCYRLFYGLEMQLTRSTLLDDKIFKQSTQCGLFHCLLLLK